MRSIRLEGHGCLRPLPLPWAAHAALFRAAWPEAVSQGEPGSHYGGSKASNRSSPYSRGGGKLGHPPNPATFTFPGLGRPCLRLDGPLVIVLPIPRRVGQPALIGAKGYGTGAIGWWRSRSPRESCPSRPLLWQAPAPLCLPRCPGDSARCACRGLLWGVRGVRWGLRWLWGLAASLGALRAAATKQA